MAMANVIAILGVSSALLGSTISFLVVRRGQDLLARQHERDTLERVRQGQVDITAASLGLCARLLDHAYDVTHHWDTNGLAQVYGAPIDSGPGGVGNWRRPVGDSPLRPLEFYGTDVEKFHRARHELLLASYRVGNAAVRIELIEFHDRVIEILGYEQAIDGVAIRRDLKARYEKLMAIGGEYLRQLDSHN